MSIVRVRPRSAGRDSSVPTAAYLEVRGRGLLKAPRLRVAPAGWQQGQTLEAKKLSRAKALLCILVVCPQPPAIGFLPRWQRRCARLDSPPTTWTAAGGNGRWPVPRTARNI